MAPNHPQKALEDLTRYLLLLAILTVTILAVAQLAASSASSLKTHAAPRSIWIFFPACLCFAEYQYWRKFDQAKQTPAHRFASGSLRLAQFVFLGMSPAYLRA